MKEINYDGPVPSKREDERTKRSVGGEHSPTLRTFRGDVEELIQEKGVTKTQAVMAEAERREKRGDARFKEDTASHLGWALFALILMFAFLAGIAAYAVFGKEATMHMLGIEKGAEEVVQKEETTNDGYILLENSIHSQIVADMSILFGKTSLNKDSQRRIHFSVIDTGLKRDATTKEFFAAVAPQASQSLIRSLEPEFESGIAASTNLSGYFIFTSKSYPNTFAEMLKWENSMSQELLAVVLPWSSPQVQERMSTFKYSDQIVAGINTRAIKTANGDILLLYGFPKKDKLLIAGDEKVFQTIAQSLQSK